MSDTVELAVAAGMAVGIAFIILFAIIFNPVDAQQQRQSYRDKKIIAATVDLEPVRVFTAVYKNTTVMVDRNQYASGISVVYSSTKFYETSPSFPFPPQYATAEMIIPMTSSPGLSANVTEIKVMCSVTSQNGVGGMGYLIYPASSPTGIITLTEAIQLNKCAK
jgi:hypothetical protein